jgi:hypothetical protein
VTTYKAYYMQGYDVVEVGADSVNTTISRANPAIIQTTESPFRYEVPYTTGAVVSKITITGGVQTGFYWGYNMADSTSTHFFYYYLHGSDGTKNNGIRHAIRYNFETRRWSSANPDSAIGYPDKFETGVNPQMVTTTCTGVQHCTGVYGSFTNPYYDIIDPFYVAPPVLPAFGEPNLVSAIPDTAIFVGGSKTFNVASHFNATKSPGSAFKYFVTTNNHALLIIQNAIQDLGTFELKSLNTSGNATVTVKVVAVERDVDVWVATSTFAVSVGNNAPTLEVALPDVSGTQDFSLSEYFKDDHVQLTYSLTVEDPNVVNRARSLLLAAKVAQERLLAAADRLRPVRVCSVTPV